VTFEYLERTNIGATAMKLAGASFDRGLHYFPDFTLNPGNRCLVVANIAAFHLDMARSRCASSQGI